MPWSMLLQGIEYTLTYRAAKCQLGESGSNRELFAWREGPLSNETLLTQSLEVNYKTEHLSFRTWYTIQERDIHS